MKRNGIHFCQKKRGQIFETITIFLYNSLEKHSTVLPIGNPEFFRKVNSCHQNYQQTFLSSKLPTNIKMFRDNQLKAENTTTNIREPHIFM